MSTISEPAAAGETSRRLYVYNGGFLTQSRVRRILSLAGYDIRLGKPGDGDAVGVWGQSPTAPRGEAVADLTECPIIRVEDAFLRSVLTGRDGEAGLGLHIDNRGVHFDPSVPSDLEVLLAEHPLDDTGLLSRAKGAMAQLQRLHLSKYNATDPGLPPPEPGYVLVIDQTRGDASVKASGCDLNSFREMLFYAQTEHPNARILIKTHPETSSGHRGGYFSEADCTADRITICSEPHSPYALFEGAIAVYTVSSQLGFEAILTGHKPVVFGQPFYMGWGLTDDRRPLQRRQRRLTRAQLFAAAMILYPIWYDPYRDRLCDLEDVIASLSAMARNWREDRQGWNAAGIRLWKRKHMQAFFARYAPVKFIDGTTTGDPKRRTMIWASKAGDTLGAITRVEDGLLRSRGLGAKLIPPLSLVCDDIGIYYDPSRPSRLEELIEASTKLGEADLDRARKVISRLIAGGLSKYTLPETKALPDLPKGRRILVPGQVADDASVILGTEEITSNAALIEATRAANPAAIVIYKPHPDVEAGLRDGALPDVAATADVVLHDVDAVAAIEACDEVWTMTSTLGFEALLRGKRVTCLGTPFYAGWGLTDDRAMPLPRRTALPDLPALVHAVLIDYPRYLDPVTQLPCPIEVILDRLEAGEIAPPGPGNRMLSKLQGVFSSFAHLWR